MRTVLRGGRVVDGTGSGPRRADLAMRDGTIDAVGRVTPHPGDTVIDVGGRYLLPGFIDAHSHADGAVFRPEVQRALLRQGVTTVVGGQDGVSFAPGDGTYGREYFAAINGGHPTYAGGGVSALLTGYDDTTPINVGYLVPAGTVRHEVMGFSALAPTRTQLARMSALVEEGMAQGALGLSSGLDYVPGSHATSDELTMLCQVVARAGGLYVTHMRGGYEENSRTGLDEVSAVAQGSGVAVHVSHLHGPSGLILPLLDAMRDEGIDLSFDAYPYRRGCTLLAMPILPPELLSRPREEVAARLGEASVRAQVQTQWRPVLEADPVIGSDWPERLTVAHVAAEEYGWTHGRTLAEAARELSTDPMSLALDLIVASRGEVSVVMAVRDHRPYADFARLLHHRGYTAGSDGIYVGRHPHPRAWGTFARLLGMLTRAASDDAPDPDVGARWAAAAWRLSGHAARRYGLSEQGRLERGAAADVAVVDPGRLADAATYANPTAEADGVDDVFVAGRHVLASGELTGITSGAGLRRSLDAADRRTWRPTHQRTTPEEI